MIISGMSIEETRATLREIVGLKLLKSRNFCATRHFYFGREISPPGSDRSHYTLGVECPWRIQKSGLIVVGSDDYFEAADDNTDPAWEPGMPGGHRQDRKLVELLGELSEGDIINTRPGFVVEALELDSCCSIRIDLGQTCVLEIFPVSAKRMQWIFMPPARPSLVLVDGVVHESKNKRPKRPGREPGSAES